MYKGSRTGISYLYTRRVRREIRVSLYKRVK
jgi:hypothetical protein